MENSFFRNKISSILLKGSNVVIRCQLSLVVTTIKPFPRKTETSDVKIDGETGPYVRE